MFIVLEIQTNADGTVGSVINSYGKHEDAMSRYHEILMYAAKSALPRHTAVVLTAEGYIIKSESYTHNVEEESNEE